jgi:hypothetical protein
VDNPTASVPEPRPSFIGALSFLTISPYLVWLLILGRDIVVGGKEPAVAYYFLPVLFAIGSHVIILGLRSSRERYRPLLMIDYLTYVLAGLLATWMAIRVAQRPDLAAQERAEMEQMRKEMHDREQPPPPPPQPDDNAFDGSTRR